MIRAHRAILLVILPVVIVWAGCLPANRMDRGSQRGPNGGYLVEVSESDAGSFSSLQELLITRVPGIRRAPDGDGIVIRGSESVTGSRDPLYVVDGTPVISDGANVRLHDIDTIEVITSASSTASYGMRGANGVILIRTKGSAED